MPGTSPTDNESAVTPAGDSDRFLQLLGRAVRQLRTYSPSHALSLDAVAACHRELLAGTRADDVVVRVGAGTLRADGQEPAVGDHVLLAPLQRARVAELSVSRDASPRDLTRFGLELLAAGDTGTSLAERLAAQGITAISVRLLPKPELLDVPTPGSAQRDLLSRERHRRDERLAAGSSTLHLYAPDKGWLRIDPSVHYRTFSLSDLAILIEDPAALAGMLARLDDDGTGDDVEGRSVLERRFRDVARLLASLEPRLSRLMFSRLSRVVLAMDPVRRGRLLRETVLPGLLDGGAEATILHDFPDTTLAESLCLLLDLETAAPEVVDTALDRLGVTAERRTALEPLVAAEIQRRGEQDDAAADAELDWYARRMTRIDGAAGMSFTDFAAFDLSMTEQTGDELQGLQQSIEQVDALTARLDCLRHLATVEPHPETVAAFMAAVHEEFGRLHSDARWSELARHAAPLRDLAVDIRARRPEVADTIEHALAAFCTPDVARTLVLMHHGEPVRRQEAADAIDAFGNALAPAFLSLLDESLAPAVADSLATLMMQRATTYAPTLVAQLSGDCPPATARRIVKILGHAGTGVEDALVQRLGDADEDIVREALGALARVGTPAAAAHVAAQLSDPRDWVRGAALESLLRLPAATARIHARAALARSDLATRHPLVMRALLDRMTRTGTDGMKDVLHTLAPLRFRFWSPAVSRLGRRAHALLAS